MNRYQPLLATHELTVNRFDHPPHEVHEDPDREVGARWAIAFVREGRFDIEAYGVRRRLAPGGAFLVSPGLAFRCFHHERCPTDVCLSIGFDDAAVDGYRDAWGRAGWIAREAATPRLAYVHRRLAIAEAESRTESLEHWAVEALSALVDDAADGHPSGAKRGPYSARAAEVDAVVAVCRAIEANPVERRTLALRAGDVHLTSARLTHAFRRYVGVSPHQYVLQHRLLRATEWLAQGHSVSDSCYRAGFENLSHFCRSFQRAFGVRASQWRRQPARETRRIVQAVGRVSL